MRIPKIVVVGSLNMDIVVEAPRPPQMGETIMGEKVHFIPGGKGANQAVALARLGAETTMIGAVGQDSFGTELLKALQVEGISTEAIKRQRDVATGVASILLAQGDNQIIVVPGANAQCLPEDVEQQEHLIAAADLILLQLEIPLVTVIKTVEIAKKHGKQVILNPAPAQALPIELLRRVDVLTPNRSELELITGKDSSVEGLELAVQELLNRGVGQVVTTLGSAGAAYANADRTISKLPANKVEVVDTTGAGDAFNAGLAYVLAQEYDWAAAVEFAGRVSALAVMRFGAQAGMPTLEEVRNFQA